MMAGDAGFWGWGEDALTDTRHVPSSLSVSPQRFSAMFPSTEFILPVWYLVYARSILFLQDALVRTVSPR